MSCPQCGGDDRLPIAQSYWQCTSMVATTVGAPVDPLMAGSPQRPEPRVFYEPCGYRYQEATGGMPETPACACGMFSVGSCSVCQTHCCGVHGRLVADRFLCQDHARQQDARARAEARTKNAPPPPAQSLAEEIRSLTDAADANRIADAEAGLKQQLLIEQTAADLYPKLLDLVREVLAMPTAKSCTYTVYGSSRKQSFGLKLGPKRVDDPLGIGTLVSDDVGGGSGYWSPRSTYTNIWPAMVWLTGWTATQGETRAQPLVSSLWFNCDGRVIAGSSEATRDAASNTINPSISYYCSTGSPNSSATTASPFPSASLFGPIRLDSLSLDHIVTICSEALIPPTILRKSLARIVLGTKPEMEYEAK
jgi:hypothetical protein